MDYDRYLPGPARAKLDALREDAVVAVGMRRTLNDRVIEAHRDAVNARAHAAQVRQAKPVRRMVTTQMPGGGARSSDLGVAYTIGPDERAIAEADAALDAAETALQRWRAREAEDQSRIRAIGDLVQSIEAWLEGQSAPLKAHGGKVALPKGSPADVVAAVRAEIERLDEEMEVVRRSPLPSGEAKARMRTMVDEIARRGEPSAFELIERGAPIAWPREHYVPALQREPVDVLAVLVWAGRDAIVEQLDAVIDREAADEHAVGTEDKAKRLAKLAADRLLLERQEEAAIMVAAAQGVSLTRRADANPIAVLELEG